MANIRDYMKIVETLNEGWNNPFVRKEEPSSPEITNPAIKGQHAKYAEMSNDDEMQYRRIRSYFHTNGVDQADPDVAVYVERLRDLAKKYAGTTVEPSITKFIDSINK